MPKTFNSDMLTQEKRFVLSVTQFAEEVLPLIEEYRQKNVNKYHRERDLEFSEYTKMERYKNRVRICDIVLLPLRQFLMNVGVLRSGTEPEETIE